MAPYDLLIAPLLEHAYLRRALVAGLALAVAAGPIGVLLTLRRLALIGDALAHAILPGVAFGFALAGGFSVLAMSAGGLLAGLVVVLAAGWAARVSALAEDAVLAGAYLSALALGVLVATGAGGGDADLTDLLFGDVQAIDEGALLFIAGAASVTLLALAAGWRGFVLETLDREFLAASGGAPDRWQTGFLALLLVVLVAACQAVGTLMAVGLMVLPALAAQFWAAGLAGIVRAAIGIGVLSVLVGLAVSFRLALPVGPAIVLAAAAAWVASMLGGPVRSLAAQRRPRAGG